MGSSEADEGGGVASEESFPSLISTISHESGNQGEAVINDLIISQDYSEQQLLPARYESGAPYIVTPAAPATVPPRHPRSLTSALLLLTHK